jgi:hypothetical protein
MWPSIPPATASANAISASNASVLHALNNNQNQRNREANNNARINNINANSAANNNNVTLPNSTFFSPELLQFHAMPTPTPTSTFNPNNHQQAELDSREDETQSQSQSSQSQSQSSYADKVKVVTSRAKLAANSAAVGAAKSDAVNAAVTALVNSSAATIHRDNRNRNSNHTPSAPTADNVVQSQHVRSHHHYPPTMLGPDYTPTDQDVCCGRGKQNWNMPGNIFYRKVVRDAVNAYVAAGPSLKHKLKIVAKIIDDIRKQGGRFVKEGTKPPPGLGDVDDDDEYSDRFFWYDIGDAAARGKVGHSLRDTLGKSSSHSVSAVQLAVADGQQHALSIIHTRPSQVWLKNNSPLELAKLVYERNRADAAAAAAVDAAAQQEGEAMMPNKQQQQRAQGPDPVVTASFNAWLLHQKHDQQLAAAAAARAGPGAGPPPHYELAPPPPLPRSQAPPPPLEVGSSVTAAAFNAWLSSQHQQQPASPPATVRSPPPQDAVTSTSAAMNMITNTKAWLQLQQQHQPAVARGLHDPPPKTAPPPPRLYAPPPPQHPHLLQHLFHGAPAPPTAAAAAAAAAPQHLYPVHIPVPVPVPYFHGAYSSYPGAFASAAGGANPFSSPQSPAPSSLYPPPPPPPPAFADYRSLLVSTLGAYQQSNPYASAPGSTATGTAPAPSQTSTPFPYAAYAALAQYRASQMQPQSQLLPPRGQLPH